MTNGAHEFQHPASDETARRPAPGGRGKGQRSVAIVADTFPRWSERFIARELNELARRGIQFSIYCLKAGDPDCGRDPEFAGLMPRRVVLPSCFLPSFARDLGLDDAAKARFQRVENELGVTAFRQIGCANSLAKLIRENGQGIVYAHFASLPSTLGWLAAAALKLPLVISAHARDVFVEAQLLREKIEYARTIFTCNKHAAAHLEDMFSGMGEILRKIALMPHGLPLEHYACGVRRERSAVGKNLRLLAAGRFVPKKGFDILIDALARPELEDATIELTLLGDGPERRALEKRAAQLRSNVRVSMPGVVFDPELKQHFDWADVFVMPSIETKDGDSDGLPNVLLEAFAYRLPVIGTDAGSLSDVLRRKTGVVIESSKAAEFEKAAGRRDVALAIREALREPERAIERAETARTLIEERYDIRKNIEPLIKELSEP